MKTLFFILLLSTSAISAEHLMINSIGVSPKGQFVALEEYGYGPEDKKFHVQIKIMNVWTKEYVGSEISVEVSALHANLDKVREKAKFLAQDQLIKYKISG